MTYLIFSNLDLQYSISSICSDKSLRDKACALEGARAARFSDLVHLLSTLSYSTLTACLNSAWLVPRHMIYSVCCRIFAQSLANFRVPTGLNMLKCTGEIIYLRGREACIYPGNLGGRRVVVREVSKPGDATWSSPEGRQIIEVSTLATTMQHVNSVHFLVAAD